MGRYKDKVLWNVLLGSGAYLLDSMRDRLSDNYSDARSRARDTYSSATERARDAYSTAADRVSRAGDALRGEDSNLLGTAAAFVLGIGVGVGVGMLLAPASGEETRSSIADKVSDFGSRVRNRVSVEPSGATGTYGE
jgi:hypothetical protein